MPNTPSDNAVDPNAGATGDRSADSSSPQRRDGNGNGTANDPALVGDLFRLGQHLKHENRVRTYLGTRTTDDRQVVIKATDAAALSTGARIRLEHEVQLLQQVERPVFAAPLFFGQQADVFCLVTPFVPGRTLEARLAEGPLAVSEALTVGIGLMKCLQQLHDQRVLHRDVKPTNLIVNHGDALSEVTLVDFGLARRTQLDPSIRDQPVGTARYLAPEQAGLLDVDVDAYSDLYSAGVVLFECLAGRPPFSGDSVGELLRQHMTVTPPELRSLGLAVPRALDEVLQRMLLKDPRDRYQSAAAVLADLTVIAYDQQGGASETTLVVGLHDRRRTLTEPAFVGRRAELQTLDELARETTAGRGGFVLIEAESGGGKTRLLTEVTQRCTRQGMWLLRGQGLDHVGQRPFQLLAGVERQLVAEAGDNELLGQTLRHHVEEYREAIADVMPDLAEVWGWSSSATRASQAVGEGRRLEGMQVRSLHALVALFEALGECGKPAVIILDDCQWADELTVRLFQQFQRRVAERDNPLRVLLLVAFRTEEVPADAPLRQIQSSGQVILPPFGDDGVRQLAESMAGPLPEEAIETVQTLSEGSPFMASAVLRGLVETGALVSEADGWRVEPLALADVQSLCHAAAFLARRIDLLPDQTRELLSIGAALGKQFDLDVAVALSGRPPRQVIAAVDEARLRHLLWLRPDGISCVFVHDKVRAALLSTMDEEQLRELHRGAAEHLEENYRDRVFEIAYHFDAAGQFDRALDYAMEAAELARSRHSLEVAVQHYSIAARGAAANDRATQFRVAEGLGDVLMLQGQYQPAAGQFAAAAELTEDRIDQARIQGKVGELAFKQGDIKSAVESLEEALRLLGQSTPRSPLSLFLWLGWETVVQTLHTWMPFWFVGRRRFEQAGNDLLTVRLLNRLTYAYWFARGGIPAMWAQLRQMNIVERYPAGMERSEAYSTHAPLMSVVWLYSRGIRYVTESYRIRKDRGDLWGQGQSLHFHGVILYTASRFEECVKTCREAIRLLERTGDYWELNIARYQLAASLYRLGDLSGAIAEARKIHALGLKLGDALAEGICLDIWSPASSGRIPAGAAERATSRLRHDAQGTAQTLTGEGVRLLLSERDPQAAVEVFQRGREAAARGGVRNTYVTPLHGWLAAALIECLAANRDLTHGRRRSLLRRARWAAFWSCLWSLPFQNDRPFALRQAAVLAGRRGRVRKARRLIDKSLAVAEQQGAKYEHAQSLRVRGQMGVECGWPGSAEQLALAESQLRRFDEMLHQDASRDAPQATLSLLDRFDTVLDVGRKIATGLSREVVFEAAREAAISLLRSEDCVILPVDDPPSSDPTEFDETVAEQVEVLRRRALDDGRAITLEDARDLATGDEVGSAGIRSALCVPIYVRGAAVACLLVTHRQVSGLFHEEETRLAEFIATLAGAALENAEGFSQLQQLAATLEERVRDRTKHIEAQNLELEHQKQELARSNEELEQFAYIASHDLQEPLRTVASYCQLLARRYKGKLDTDADEFIAYAVDGATRMKTLISDLLAYSRVGTQGRAFQSVDSNEVMQRILASLKIFIEDNLAEVTCGPLPVIMVDPTQFAQLLQNLVVNGIKFRGEQAPRVRVQAERIDDAWRFSVRDNGIGIDPQFHERIFKVFQRLHTAKDYDGTGIGLSICRKTVERHGGRIWVESIPGNGSTFWFEIPIRDLDPLDTSHTLREGEAPAEPPTP